MAHSRGIDSESRKVVRARHHHRKIPSHPKNPLQAELAAGKSGKKLRNRRHDRKILL
jgi:hypothetical protein